MNEELKAVPEHMRLLGLAALTHANRHANYFSPENSFWPELSVLQAAHAAEILVKARIAEEHPLLIFEKLPRSGGDDLGPLELKHLFEQGRTLQYADLPDRLWAVTGLKLANLEQYRDFGKLRNTVQHFAPPADINFGLKSTEFIYGVIDPFINNCWGLCAIDFNEDYEPYEYLIPGIVARGILFNVSYEAATDLDRYLNTSLEWPEHSLDYRKEMEKRIKEARKL